MKKLIKKAAIGMVAFFVVAASGPVFAAVGDQGVDWSKYNGDYGNFGYDHDKFAFSQIGGTYGGSFVDQATYSTQVASAIAQGKRAHTYIWYQVGGSQEVAKAALDRYLPKIQTPKNSIVALDYEMEQVEINKPILMRFFTECDVLKRLDILQCIILTSLTLWPMLIISKSSKNSLTHYGLRHIQIMK